MVDSARITSEVILIIVYTFSLLFFSRRLGVKGGAGKTLVILFGLATGVFIWPWVYITSGWLGASLGAAISSGFNLQTHTLVLVGALISAALGMCVVSVCLYLL